MTVAWPLPCHVGNDASFNNLLIIAREFHYGSKVSGTGFLAGSGASATKHVKDLFGPMIPFDIDPALPASMADSNPHQDCSLNDRAADDGRSFTDNIYASLKENNLWMQSDSHLPGGINPKAGKEERVLEPAEANVGMSYQSLQLAGNDERPRNVDCLNLNVEECSKNIDSSMDSHNDQLTKQPTTLVGSSKNEEQLASSNINVDFRTQTGSGGNAFATVVGTGVQHHFEDGENHLLGVDMSRRSDTSSSGCSERNSSISLRAWLSNSARVVDKVENLHIFKQIAEFVDLAHSQGVVLRNVRPSSFLLSSISRVSIIESASSGTSSGSSAESTGRVAAPGLADTKLIGPSTLKPIARDSASAQLMDFEMQNELATDIPVGKQRGTQFHNESTSSGHGGADGTQQEFQVGKEKHTAEEQGGRSFTSSSSDHAGDQLNDKKFPLKQILSLEMIWYRSPEDTNGGTPDFPSDVYSLGVLFLELFYSAGSQGEWPRAMSDIRHRLLPPSFLLEHPKEAAFCLLLLHPNPNSRPKARDVLHSDVFNEIEDKLAEREAIMNLEEKLSEAEMTLDFLLQMQQKKHVFIQKLAQELNSLNEDIKEVERWQALLKKNRRWNESVSTNSIRLVESPKAAAVGGYKLSSDHSFANKEVTGSGYSQDGFGGRRQGLLLAKSAQLMRSFTYLREAYLSIIKSDDHSGYGLKIDISRQSGPGQGSCAVKMGTSRFLNSFTSSKAEQGDSRSRLGCFFDDFCKFMKYSSFDVKATLQYGDILNTKNMVCSLSFDCDAEFFVTAGVSRRVKIFDCNALLEESNDIHYPVFEMNSRKKLSCVCWNNFRKNHLASSDLEGAIQLWDVTAARTIMEFKEHGKCAWSVDFSHSDSTQLASGSDDCCVKLWSTNQGASVGTIKTKANICSVQFSPDHSHMLAFGSADSQVYFHDLRYIRIPVRILTGHQKAVSFIKFAGPEGIVSASTDNTLKLWDLTKTRGHGARLGSRNDCITTYSGHTNVKNFVGLSVAEESYIACGSETNEVFVYHKSLPVAMLTHKFKNADPISGQELDDVGDQFVSSVCWRNKSQVLVTANSVGNIQVLEMV